MSWARLNFCLMSCLICASIFVGNGATQHHLQLVEDFSERLPKFHFLKFRNWFSIFVLLFEAVQFSLIGAHTAEAFSKRDSYSGTRYPLGAFLLYLLSYRLVILPSLKFEPALFHLVDILPASYDATGRKLVIVRMAFMSSVPHHFIVESLVMWAHSRLCTHSRLEGLLWNVPWERLSYTGFVQHFACTEIHGFLLDNILMMCVRKQALVLFSAINLDCGLVSVFILHLLSSYFFSRRWNRGRGCASCVHHVRAMVCVKLSPLLSVLRTWSGNSSHTHLHFPGAFASRHPRERYE